MTDSTGKAIIVQDLVKHYGSTQALRGVSLEIDSGSVHALVGENGAGKSTALGVIAGRVSPTSGRVEVFGEELSYGEPRSSRRAGVVAIYQELTIVPAMTAEANVFLAGPLNRGGFLTKREMRRRYEELCENVGVASVPQGVLARDLGIAEQQILEIMRALVGDAKIVLFDEPTASLAVPEREALFRLIRKLRSSGITIVLVSHNLDEVLDISDRISVFRDGRLILTEERAHFTKQELVRAMIGKAGDLRIGAELLDEAEGGAAPSESRRRRPVTSGTPVLAVSNLSVPSALTGVELEVHSGEVLGLGGLVGSGRTSVLRALAGLTPNATGRMWIDGKEVSWPTTVRKALRYGIALIPEDRKSQGLIMDMRVAENISISDLRSIARAGVLFPKAVVDSSAQVAPAFGLSTSRLRDPASALSGGNQQKLLLARWKHVTPRILLADEPSRGIDVGAKAEILRSLEGMADEGLGIVIVSSELEEVVAISDRVLVLSEGLPVGVLDSADGPLTTHEILDLAFRVHSSETRA